MKQHLAVVTALVGVGLVLATSAMAGGPLAGFVVRLALRDFGFGFGFDLGLAFARDFPLAGAARFVVLALAGRGLLFALGAARGRDFAAALAREPGRDRAAVFLFATGLAGDFLRGAIPVLKVRCRLAVGRRSIWRPPCASKSLLETRHKPLKTTAVRPGLGPMAGP